MYFDEIYLIGSGSICNSIIKSLSKRKIEPVVLSYKEHGMSSLSMYCKSNNIKNYSFNDKRLMTNFLDKITTNCLIISANNIFLFPKNIVSKNNLKIINFHNALLPAHRGMNAPTWTIFEQDKYAGITWHLVNENIDDGDIIIQKSIELDNSETAIILIKKLMNLAFKAYLEIEDNLLNWKIKTTKMPKGKYQIHYAKDIPNKGVLNNDWDFDKISAFLRSLDWGCVHQFEKPKIKLANKFFTINSYKLINPNKLTIDTDEGSICFKF